MTQPLRLTAKDHRTELLGCRYWVAKYLKIQVNVITGEQILGNDLEGKI
ncbi:MAG: hypothetical protein GDA38_14490 [Hormoscilla sp. SP12CHS1]|nr:hypothetical protein [Hormoscilla sp. SP12CHS1]